MNTYNLGDIVYLHESGEKYTVIACFTSNSRVVYSLKSEENRITDVDERYISKVPPPITYEKFQEMFSECERGRPYFKKLLFNEIKLRGVQ